MGEIREIPPILTKDEWNALIDHSLEKPVSFIIRKSGTNYEAIHGSTSDQAGKIYGTPSTNPIAQINNVLQNGLTAGRTNVEKVTVKGEITYTDSHSSSLPIQIEDYTLFDLTQAKFIDNRTQLGDDGGDHTADKWRNFITNKDLVSGNEHITVLGGILRGERGSIYYTDPESKGYCSVGRGIGFENVTYGKVIGTKLFNWAGNGSGFYSNDRPLHYDVHVKNCGGLGGFEITQDISSKYVYCLSEGNVYDGWNWCSSTFFVTIISSTAYNNNQHGFNSSSGTNLRAMLSSCVARENQKHGFVLRQSDSAISCWALNNSQIGTGQYDGLYSSTGYITVIGGKYWAYSPKRQRYGIHIPSIGTADANYQTIIVGVDAVGNQDATYDIYYPKDDGWGDPVKTVIIGVAGRIRYSGAITVPSVPGSGAAIPNNYGVPMTVYIDNSGSGVSVYVNNTDVGISPPCTVHLAPNEEIKLLYTSAPGWVWIGER